MAPLSVQEPGSMVVDVARPMEEACDPKVETA